MIKITLSVLLVISIGVNCFLFMKVKGYENPTPIAFEKASNDLTMAFEEPKAKKKSEKKKVKPVSKIPQETFKVLDSNEETQKEVILSDFPEPKKEIKPKPQTTSGNVWISYGFFKTEHFLVENIKKVESMNLPYKVFQKKELSNLRLGPFSKKEAQLKIKNVKLPSDVFLIHE